MENSKNIQLIVGMLAIGFIGGYFLNGVSMSTISPNSQGQSQAVSDRSKIYKVEFFHGIKLGNEAFRFKVPANWFFEGQYLSPQPIEFYDMNSVRASFYYDFVLADIFDQTALKYQIDQSKRNSPDSHGTIAGKEFKRYDLIDYGSYGGDSAGRVIIYVGPKTNINNAWHYLVFYWEEKPLGQELPQNNPEAFEGAVKSLKFGI